VTQPEPPVADLSKAQAAVHARLQAKHDARERSLRDARTATRHAANAIRAIHRDDRDAAERMLQEAADALQAALEACADHPEVEYAGFIHDAAKEYAEARTTVAVVTGEPLPGPDDVGVSEVAWLNGLAEAVGEFRRRVLDELRTGNLSRCEHLLIAMEDIYGVLISMDFPEAVTAGLRRSTDAARSVLERTRGDLTAALLQDRLRKALDAHRLAILGDRDADPAGSGSR
jgi:translin